MLIFDSFNAEFTKQVSKLQTELNSVKIRESEAQEQIIELNNALEKERRARQIAESKSKVSIFGVFLPILCYQEDISLFSIYPLRINQTYSRNVI